MTGIDSSRLGRDSLRLKLPALPKATDYSGTKMSHMVSHHSLNPMNLELSFELEERNTPKNRATRDSKYPNQLRQDYRALEPTVATNRIQSP